MLRHIAAILVLASAASCPFEKKEPPPTTTTSTSTSTTTTTTLPPEGCHAPQGVKWIEVPTTRTFGPVVNDVMAKLTGCEVGSACKHGALDQAAWAAATQGDRYVLEHRAAQMWMERVAAGLRARGLCASQANEAEGSDDIMVGETCSGVFTEYKVANFGGGSLIWAAPAGGAERSSFRPGATGPNCETSLPPAPLPKCPLKLDADHFIDVRIKQEPGARVRLDATAYLCGFPLPEGWGCGTKCCSLATERGPLAAACEAALFGVPVWRPAAPGDMVIEHTANPFTVIVFGKGKVEACSSRHPASCGRFLVQ
jgi:hypothetical protein